MTRSKRMAIRPILHYPDKRLRETGADVEDFGSDFQTLIDDMAETMYAAPGVGLAAPQIGVSFRVFIIDTATDDDEPSDLRIFTNPVLTPGEERILFDEGCLSFPGAREEIERSETVRVQARDRHGEHFDIVADGLLAIAVQHENDHLEGKLMIDKLGVLRRRMLHRAMLKRTKD